MLSLPKLRLRLPAPALLADDVHALGGAAARRCPHAGDYSTALEELLGIPVACAPLPGGIELWCDRDGLLSGLLLVRRAVAMSLAKLGQSKITLVFDRSDPGLGLDEWPVSGDFLLARATDDGRLVDLTESDVTLFMSWLKLVYIQRRGWT